MQHLLTDQQKIRHKEFKNFVTLNVEPFAERWDREQRIPDPVISHVGEVRLPGLQSAARLWWTGMGHQSRSVC